MASLADVAARVGVSTSTASRALNRPDMVRPDVVERVRAAADALGYSPNPFARSLRLRGSKTLGLLIPDNTNPFFAEVAKGIEAACFRAGYTLILCNSDRSLEKERAQAQALRDKRVDGVLLFNVSDRSADTVRWLTGHGLPVLLLERRLPGLGADAILSDNRAGIRLAVAHLANFGHRALAFLDGDLAASHYAERLAAFRSALTELGLPTRSDWLCAGLATYADGQRAAQDLLQASPAPTALVYATDTLAIGALRGAALAGKRVPEDVAVTGYGDIELAAYTQPPLTSVVQEKLAVGARAVRLLLRRVEQRRHGESWRPKVEVVPTRLAARASSGDPRPNEGTSGQHQASADQEAAGARA